MKLKPFCYTPRSFVDFVRSNHEASLRYGWDICFVYLSLVWGNAGNNKRFQHATKQHCFTITAALLTERFGRNYESIFSSINLISYDSLYNVKKGTTKPYRLTKIARRLVMQYMISDHNQTDILGINNRPYPLKTNNNNGVANGIKSRDKNGNNKASNNYINPIVNVNIGSLEALKDTLLKHRDKAFHSINFNAANDSLIDIQSNINAQPIHKLESWIDRRLIATMQLIHLATMNVRLPSGNIIQYYVESSTGRLYGQDVHLQTLPSEVRKAALVGQCDYDIENCHYAILHQLANKVKVQTPSIKTYLANKREIRTKLANSLNVSVDVIKECLIALIYGASIKEKPRHALSNTLGADGLNKLLRHRIFVGLHQDIKKAGKAVLQSQVNNSQLKNPMNKKLVDDNANGLCHILQGYEAKMLNIALEMHSDSITLLQHDGFTSTNLNIEVEQIEAEILSQTGLKMAISKSVLKMARMHSNQNPESLAA